MLPWTSVEMTDSTTSPRKLAREKGGKVTNCTRDSTDCFAPDMSWLMLASIWRASSGWSAKYWSSDRFSFTHQKRMSRRGLGIFPSSIIFLNARASSSTLAHPLPSSLAENFSSCRWAVSMMS